MVAGRPSIDPPRHGALELGPEQLEIDHVREPLELIALLRQPRSRSSTSNIPTCRAIRFLPETHAA